MKIIYFFSNSAILVFLLIVIFYGIIDKKNIFELFISGAIEGEKIVIDLFPILLALIVATGMLNKSGFLVFISNIIEPILKLFNINKELAPLILVRPISGNTTLSVATQLMQKYGVDSKIGIISSCIMGSTETTIYVASIYSSKVKIKNIKEVIIIGLFADLIGIVMSCMAYNIGLIKI